LHSEKTNYIKVMATTSAPVNLTGLARRLVQDSILTDTDAQEAVLGARKKRIPFVSYLIENKMAAGMDIAVIASMEYGVPLFDLDAIDTEVMPVKLVAEKLIRKHHALPLYKRGNKLFLALSDPTAHQSLDEVRFHTGLATEAVLVDEEKLIPAIEKALSANDTTMSDMLDEDLGNLDFVDTEKEADTTDDSGIDDAPIVRFVNKVLVDAINQGVSDIHLEPYEKFYRIRFRQDGMLHEYTQPPNNIASRITSRIKVMSRMNIAERRVPQDGRIKLTLSKTRSIDFRVNTCPTVYGEKIVMRILDPTSAQLGIEALGFEALQMESLTAAIKKPYGMILVTGPTGSGKTVSLYTCLNLLNEPTINISTAEDPVEIQVAGINQVNVNPAQGLTFAEALRAFLRQDPDIVMVGEIRDLETAEIAIKAAQTGHLVLSTLHTNDAPQTLTRLANMGIPPYNIAGAVNLIMAQRLARRLCKHCKVVDDVPGEALIKEGFKEDEVHDLTLYKAKGCDKCTKGYKGRVGIYQVMPISAEMERIIMEEGNSLELAAQAAKERINDLRASGLNKVRLGVTSLEEINRVTKE
jgi:type IV pilus assembly protein PilB